MQYMIILLTIGAVSTTNCPDNWVAYSGSCYLFRAGVHLSFYSAESYCQQHGGHLVHIESSAENAFILGHIHSARSVQYWIGLTDEFSEGFWKWYGTNSSPYFTYWAPGQPDDGGSGEDCAQFYNYRWNDEQCGNTHEPLCEMRA